MRLIDQELTIKALRQFQQFRQGSNIAIHAENAIADNQPVACAPTLGSHKVGEMIHIIMAINVDGRA